MLVNKFQNLFKIVCIIATLCFVVFWFVTFLKNDDVSKIEIKYFEKDKDIKQLELSVCFVNPFIEERFKDVNSSLRWEEYKNYLSGKSFNDVAYKYLNYDNVTINFHDYIEGISFEFTHGFDKKYDVCNDTYDCKYMRLYNNMNTFWDDDYFLKCYGARLYEKYSMHIRIVTFAFKTAFSSLLENEFVPIFGFNHPDQFLLTDEGSAVSKNLWIKLKVIELQKRRNKNGDQCIDLSKHFDRYILEKHIEKVGCRAPYQKALYNVSICGTRHKMRESLFDKIQVLKDELLPCQSVVSLVYTTDKLIYL